MGRETRKRKGLHMGNDLRELLKKEKVSAYRIAKETGMQPSFVGRILNGKASPTCQTLQRILDVLGYQISFKKKG